MRKRRSQRLLPVLQGLTRLKEVVLMGLFSCHVGIVASKIISSCLDGKNIFLFFGCRKNSYCMVWFAEIFLLFNWIRIIVLVVIKFYRKKSSFFPRKSPYCMVGEKNCLCWYS